MKYSMPSPPPPGTSSRPYAEPEPEEDQEQNPPIRAELHNPAPLPRRCKAPSCNGTGLPADGVPSGLQPPDQLTVRLHRGASGDMSPSDSRSTRGLDGMSGEQLKRTQLRKNPNIPV